MSAFVRVLTSLDSNTQELSPSSSTSFQYLNPTKVLPATFFHETGSQRQSPRGAFVYSLVYSKNREKGVSRQPRSMLLISFNILLFQMLHNY